MKDRGPTFITLLMVFLAVLKLTGCIGLSWWWILLPLWITPAILIGFVGLAVAAVLLALLVGCVFFAAAVLLK